MKPTANAERRLKDLAARFRMSARTTSEAERQQIFLVLANRYETLARDQTISQISLRRPAAPNKDKHSVAEPRGIL